ncbi:hypothetical protein LCP963914a_9874 [Penicillium roqueforti]|nr:hypothetical protein LCP963914a_9874 [Penicillium roqueforti]
MVVLAYEAESWMTAQRRAGSLAVIHVIPLCLGINFGFPADLLHLDRQTMAWLHRWIGRICVLHSLFHGSLMVSISRTSTLTVPIHIIPIIGESALILVVPVTYVAMRRRHRQFALKCHYVLLVIAIAGIAYHLVQRHSLYRWVLLGATGLWLICSVAVCTRTVFAQKQSRAVISSWNGNLWLDITLPLNWTVRPGQYVQLWMPSAGFRAFMQLPLFYVVICEFDEPSGDLKVRMMARPQRGIICDLYHITKGSQNSQSVKLLGPYGRPLNLSRFGTIVFILEDIGLFRALSYIKMLVEASHKREVMVRRLDIIWQRDETFVQKIRHGSRHGDSSSLTVTFKGSTIYTSRAKAGQIPLPPDERGKRLWYYDRAANFEEEVTQYLGNQHGEMAVAGVLHSSSISILILQFQNLWHCY